MNNNGRGNRKAQKYRRKKNNAGVKKQEEEFLLIDGNFSNKPYSYCCHYKGYLTKNLAIRHKCENNHCEKFKSLEWAISKNK